VTPPDPLYQAVTAALADPATRDSVRQMYADGYSLLQMVQALGLDDDMSARVQAIVAGIPDDVVSAIRQLTLDVLANDGNVLPLNCTMTEAQLQATTPAVTVQTIDGTATIMVQPA